MTERLAIHCWLTDEFDFAIRCWTSWFPVNCGLMLLISHPASTPERTMNRGSE